ncbi:MAG TPA: DUF1566 domain-containing protein [Nitrospiraceae bacterium]|nr:DUF1566 domain-containing protein [Nitrospiraceae bacterium]
MKHLTRWETAVCVFGITLASSLIWPADSRPEQALPRFSLVLDGAGVKDNQTGLIWEQEPDRIHDVWSASVERCLTKDVGGQKGWRAPSVDELKTLIDTSQHDPALPAGHPFSNIKSEIYWTATPHPTDDIVAWQVSFFSGEPVTDQKSGTRRLWCVLGEPRK